MLRNLADKAHAVHDEAGFFHGGHVRRELKLPQHLEMAASHEVFERLIQIFDSRVLVKIFEDLIELLFSLRRESIICVIILNTFKLSLKIFKLLYRMLFFAFILILDFLNVFINASFKEVARFIARSYFPLEFVFFS